MLNELKKYAEKQAEYHDRIRRTDNILDEEYHRGQRDAYATIVSIIEQGLS